MRKLLRVAKRILNKIFGTLSDLWFWKYRHFFDKNWSENYISKNSLNHPHRKLLIQKISSHAPFQSVLEVGCASGPNLFLLAKKFPKARLSGIDISNRAIETGKKWLRLQGIKNIELYKGNVLNLKIFGDETFDIVFTDAVLIYVGKNHIQGVVKELMRITKKAIILTEWKTDEKESEYVGHWAHNYEDLFRQLVPNAEVKLTKIPAEIWPGEWAEYGYTIEVEL
ncbi:MAG: class I SAM-dependent methyltransferase [Patescibacteria group bacterium]|nr:class I SAM-dependent methyltransferase [Patescibacteria group bacterium]